MKKIGFYIGLLMSLCACEKGTDFDYRLASFTAADIDSICLRANHDRLILSTGNVLDLSLKLYKKQESGDGVSWMPLLGERLDPAQVKYFWRQGDGPEQEWKGPRFSLAGENTDEIVFYATVLGKKSNEVKVIPRLPLPVVKERTIQLIFHVVEDGTLKETEFKLEPRHIQAKVEKAQLGFRKSVSTAPNAVDTKINFVLAENSPAGNRLENPGWDKLEIPAEYLDEYLDKYLDDHSTTEVWESVNRFIETKSLLWNPKEYLNIWIVRTKKLETQVLPQYKKVGAEDLPGVALTELTDETEIPPTAWGLVIRYEDFVQNDLAYFLGGGFGLLKTSYPGSTEPEQDVDYCEDTFMYGEGSDAYPAKSDGNRGFSYMSDNIMDKSSASTVVSQDQFRRILFVLENCPVRQY